MISHNNELKRYCSEPLENIENYDKAIADKEHMWHCHHRNEICLANQSRLDKGITSKEQLISDGMYYHRPACELIFLRRDEHLRLHHTGNKYCFGRKLSDETRRKISAVGMNHPDKSTLIEMTRISDGFTKVFPSQHEAARWLCENGYPRATQSHIQECCAGKHRFVYGAKWRYL